MKRSAFVVFFVAGSIAAQPTPPSMPVFAPPPSLGAPVTTTATTTTTTLPLTGRREATVDFVWFTGTPGTDGAHGGTSPALVRVDKNTAPGASVGVIEEYAGGAGAQWRSTAWIAAFTASSFASTPFLATEFSVRTGGHVDGPSAGMLTTATFLALLKGDAVKPDVTMTGTINPDGTAGPVGGIPQKLAGAAEKGKHVFGYPLGCRQSEDMRSGKMVDLEALGATLGVQAVEVRTLHDAYRLLTGVDLGVRAMASDNDVRITPELMTGAQVRVDMWRSTAEAGFGRIQPTLAAMTPEARDALAWVYTPIFNELKAAQSYEKSGQLIAAEAKWIEVAIATAAAEDELGIVGAAQAGKLEDAFAVLTPYLELQAQADKLMGEVATSFATTSNTVAAVNTVLAADSIIESLALLDAGKSGLQAAVAAIKKLETGGNEAQNRAAVSEFIILLLKSAPVLARAETSLASARMDIAFANADEAGAGKVRAEKLPDMARAYASAAAAGRAYFQSLLGIDDASSAAFAFNEPVWATASVGAIIAANLADKPEAALQLLAVASGSHAYLSAAALQNKYYALGYKDGAIGRRVALTAQMAAAREAALAGVARVKATTGRVPSRVVTEFNHAEQMREGSDDDKISALSAYWRASFAAELAAEISG
ncbi:MAG: S16 family serine protease [Deltaproteobacteria bacterium]|nr:S16 family serine protease [Deltaproteobacteria bacterium]